jgi:hypothetical protein
VKVSNTEHLQIGETAARDDYVSNWLVRSAIYNINLRATPHNF